MTSQMPVAFELVSEWRSDQAMYGPHGPTPRTPFGAATLWVGAVQEHHRYPEAVERLTLRLTDWADMNVVANALRGRSLTSHEHLDPGDRRVAHIKLIPAVAQTVRAFDDVPHDDIIVLTLVRCPDGWWRTWTLSPGRFPPAALVRDSDAWPYQPPRPGRGGCRRAFRG